MSPIEQLIRYGAFIPVMSQDEQRLLAMGELRPSVYKVCEWCRALMERDDAIEKRIREAMKKAGKPPENRK